MLLNSCPDTNGMNDERTDHAHSALFYHKRTGAKEYGLHEGLPLTLSLVS